jgi:alanine racemase
VRSAWVEVDLGAYRHNLRVIAARVAPARICPVVKANAYGHGLVACARIAEESGAAMIAVAIPEEGVELRQAGVRAPILVVGASLPDSAEEIVTNRLTQVVSRPEIARALGAAARARGTVTTVHVKVDTGMGRVGVEPEHAAEFCRWCAAVPGVRVEGVMTHFATSDEPDRGASERQLAVFRALMPAVTRALGGRPIFHTANSGAITYMPESWLDMVRPGLLSYGIPPAPVAPDLGLRSCLTVKARLTQLHTVPSGRPVGYGGTWIPERDCRLGVVPLGYADGYPRALSNRSHAIVAGQRVRVVGRVSMDQMLVDITDAPASLGDEVVLVGRQGAAEVTLWELADAVPTIVDEVMVRLHPRLPRRYTGRESS